MIVRLKLYRLFLKIGIYLLPFPAFQLGWRIWIALCQSFEQASSLYSAWASQPDRVRNVCLGVGRGTPSRYKFR